jgi:ribosome-binding protein aMBF1 (putative translation factor)
MNRFEQRLKRRMQNPDFAAGYRDMDAEISLMTALDQARETLHVSKEDLAARMGRRRESISRLLNAQEANPTLETITEMLAAIHVEMAIE